MEVEPKCAVGLLVNDTEVHVSPPRVQPSLGEVNSPKNTTFSSIITQILKSYKPACGPVPILKPKLSFRALPIEDPEKFHSLAAEINPAIVKQPYMAYISAVHQYLFKEIQNCIGFIEHEQHKSFFNVNLIQSRDFPIFTDAIYLSDCLIKQLKLQLKMRIEVAVGLDAQETRCDNIFFYTFVQVLFFPVNCFEVFNRLSQDYSMKELERETKVWLRSLAKNDANLVLNHGQHVEIPSILEKKTNRLYVGIQTKGPLISYCCVDELLASRISNSLKIIQIKPDTAPKFIFIPDESEASEKKDNDHIGYYQISSSLKRHYQFVSV